MADGVFGTAINCMDGRVQQPIIDWMKKTFNLDYVDMITEPGPDKILAEGSPEQKKTVRNKVDISVTKHGSEVIVVMGHNDCAGNPVPKEKHLEHIRAAANEITSWAYPAAVYGVWVELAGGVDIVAKVDKP